MGIDPGTVTVGYGCLEVADAADARGDPAARGLAHRATNVVRFLQDKVGMDPTRLQAVGFSEYHPLASNDKPVGRSKNRRIEIALLPMTSAPKLQARLNR